MALDAELITETAVRILGDYGLGDLSMRRLAKELDVQASALYWHVKNKQELFVLIAEHLLERVHVPEGLSPREAAAHAAVRLRAVMLELREGAEIYSLALALKGEACIPPTIRALDEETRTTLMGFVLGHVVLEQNVLMYSGSGAATTSFEEDRRFEAGVARILRD